jgi:hypothetical protein
MLLSKHCDAMACDPLIAASDVLVLRALELVGKRVVRQDRSRYKRLGNLPWFEAHCLWRVDPTTLDKALADAWSMVPIVVRSWPCSELDSAQLRAILDRYVRELVGSQRGHEIAELAYCLEAWR